MKCSRLKRLFSWKACLQKWGLYCSHSLKCTSTVLFWHFLFWDFSSQEALCVHVVFYFSFPKCLFDDRFPEVTLALRGDHFCHHRTLPCSIQPSELWVNHFWLRAARRGMHEDYARAWNEILFASGKIKWKTCVPWLLPCMYFAIPILITSSLAMRISLNIWALDTMHFPVQQQ